MFFGRGPLEAQFQEEVAERRYDGRVQLAGFREDLPRLLGCLDVLAHPADMEGLGVSLLQAAAAGVPIVASRAGGMPEAVRHEQNGLLILPGDRVALDGALRRLLDDPALRGRLGAAGRDLVGGEFSPDVMVEATLAVYRDVLGDAGGRAAV
jgi:glycosyltransferase involved in cell wall biosynthesis